MFGLGSRSLALLALGLVTFACGEDIDPLASAGPPVSGSGAVGSASSGSSAGSNTNGATDGGTATGEPTTGEPTTGETSGGANMEVCQRYIQCVSLTTPTGLPDAQAGFGADSACWSGSPADAELCIQACQTALAQAHQLFPEEDACDECLSDGECDQAAGETCIDGGCTPPCGDGKVGPGEVCDGQSGCDDDCLGPLECNPLNDFGCASPLRCSIVDSGIGSTTCVEEDFPPGSVVDVGERCGYINASTYYYCGFGRLCLSALQFDLPCDVECCVAFCDVNSPQSCPEGYTCVSYEDATGEDVSNPLSYLGLCLP
ncbi:hypothetical protein SAMN02745121_07379 [Nannocystis exedens]|uniref:Uncharacterized protein n=1 Tax=Nannocystis exedens TaxID=54 RepID=A0A1I2GLI1_9BACT|nr:hypothetical protein [Nannocystis exedens]PCC73630.1 hypothetical protein NAEX_06718 [Nannocystis exedens]SFF18073.1 hypothetical protein SAMN02745121_07379 [Nannocystis exedens]